MRYGPAFLLCSLISIVGCSSDDSDCGCGSDNSHDSGVVVQPYTYHTVVNYQGSVFRFGQSNLGGAINCEVVNQTNMPMSAVFFITLNNGYQSNTQNVSLNAYNSTIVYMGSTTSLLQNNVLTMTVTAYNGFPIGNG